MFLAQQYRPRTFMRALSFASARDMGPSGLLLTTSLPFTVMLYANLEAYDQNGAIFHCGQDWQLWVEPVDGREVVGLRAVIGGGLDIIGEENKGDRNYRIPRGELNTHLAFTYSGNGNVSGLKIYVNGVEITTLTTNSNTAPASFTNGNITLGTSKKMSVYSAYVCSGVLSPSLIAQAAVRGQLPDGITALWGYSGAGPFRTSGFAWLKTFLYNRGEARIIPFQVYGDEFMDPVNLGQRVIHSPVYRSYNGRLSDFKTDTGEIILSTQMRGGAGYSRDGLLATVKDGRLHFFCRAKANNPLAQESHQATPFVLTDFGVLAVQEDRHNSPTYVHRITDFEDQVSQIDYNFGTQNAYLNLGYLPNGNIFMNCRDGNNYRYQSFWQSSDDGQTFTKYIVSDTGNNDLWNYPVNVVGTDIVYCSTLFRDNSQASTRFFTDIFIYYTTDGQTFTSLDGAVTKDVIAGQFFTLAEMQANCLAYHTEDPASSSTLVVEGSEVLDDGTMLMYVRDRYDEAMHRVRVASNAVDTKKLTVLPPGRAQIKYISPGVYDAFVYEDRGGNFPSIVRYRTDDDFASIDAGMEIYDGTLESFVMYMSPQSAPGDPVLLYANVFTDKQNEDTKLLIYEYVPA